METISKSQGAAVPGGTSEADCGSGNASPLRTLSDQASQFIKSREANSEKAVSVSPI